MNELTLVKDNNLVAHLESFGIATNLPQRLILHLETKRDADLAAFNKKAWDDQTKPFFVYRKYRIPSTFFGFFGVISLILNVFGILGGIIIFFCGEMDWAFMKYLMGHTGATITLLLIFSILMYLDRKKYAKSLIPQQENIARTCEIDISRLTSDPLFLLEQAQSFCENQRKLIDEDLQKIDEEFKQKITEPLVSDKLSLTKWLGSLDKLRSYSEQQLPDKARMVQQAKDNISKYEQLIAQTTADKTSIESKKMFVEEQLAGMDEGINFIVALQTEYRDIDSIIADLKAESGNDDFSQQAQQMRLRAMQRINNSLDDLIENIHAIQVGIVNMAQALPEPDQFGVSSRLELAA